MQPKTYQGVPLPKNQYDIIEFLETGSNNFWEAYYWYKFRKKRVGKPTLQIASWFNKQLKRIKNHGLIPNIPFVYSDKLGNCIWANPGVNASKANFTCFSLHDAQMEFTAERNKILV